MGFFVLFKINILMLDLVVDFCLNYVDFMEFIVIICFDCVCGGKFYIWVKYSFGVFLMCMCLLVNVLGVSNSFYILFNDGVLDVVSFDFMGNELYCVFMVYVVNGNYD